VTSIDIISQEVGYAFLCHCFCHILVSVTILAYIGLPTVWKTSEFHTTHNLPYFKSNVIVL